jgi:hypothetical protein
MTELDLRAWRRQTTDSDMLGHLKIGIIKPDRRCLAEEAFGRALSELRYEVQAARD